MIVVTGGAGFIGSNLVATLNAAGHSEILVVDRFGDGDKWRNLARHEVAALVPPEQLMSVLDANVGRIEGVFHMGAISATTERDVDLIVRENVATTLGLWDWCARHQVRLIYASSAATYGDGADGFEDDPSLDALARLKPMNPYGWSKHLVDRRVARILASNGARPPQWAGLKFFNVYGPNEYHKGGQMSVVPQLVRQIQDGRPARLFRSHRADYAHGGQLRDFVWVGDVTAVMLWLWQRPDVSGLFNVGSGRARSFADLARAVFVAMTLPERIDYIDMPGDLRERYQYFTEARMDRLRAAGYDRPFTDLEVGVTVYVRDYLLAEDPYR
ncbi:MAG: ADP-glyceromanno-heptose 6-epimerase [Alphaproteobacteria bacterium]|nr:ADP-glyceromanno-heptose 6-epimerase [Alphaproteobacteria bacterium]TAD91611.1 MAG: ADP-glyceromanno-heptose 6-epimerase [Alphaproteobacteria bacterium]